VTRRLALAIALPFLLAAACKEKSRIPPPNPNVANTVAMRLVQLFYESPRMRLAAEPRSVPLPANRAAALPMVVRELIKGPAAPTSLRLFPPDTAVRGAYLLPGGTVVVDLGGPTLTDGWGTGSHQELMAIYSLVETVTANFEDAQRVRILINGSPAETLAGHISLARSFAPVPSLVEASSSPSPRE
jgi:spore germination protein GerM